MGLTSSHFEPTCSNEETFGLSIISQRAEELGKESGLKAFGTKINSSAHDESLETVEMSVTDASTIQIENSQFGTGFQLFSPIIRALRLNYQVMTLHFLT